MRVRLNIATSPLENHRRFIAGAALLGAVSLAALAALSIVTYRGLRDNRGLRSQVSRLSSEIRQFRFQHRDLVDYFQDARTKKELERAAFFNALIDQRSFQWTKVFRDLEDLLPPGVRVVSIAPRMEDGRVEVRLVIGASADEEKVAFLKKMDTAAQFSRVQVIGETRPSRQEQGDRVLLELRAWYLPQESSESEKAPAEKPAEKTEGSKSGS